MEQRKRPRRSPGRVAFNSEGRSPAWRAFEEGLQHGIAGGGHLLPYRRDHVVDSPLEAGDHGAGDVGPRHFDLNRLSRSRMLAISILADAMSIVSGETAAVVPALDRAWSQSIAMTIPTTASISPTSWTHVIGPGARNDVSMG